MKCCFCGKEINEFDHDSYEWVDLGDAIHKSCRQDYDKQFERICNMSDDEFKLWLRGVID